LEIEEYPEVAAFLTYLRLKNLAPGTIGSYKGMLRGLIRHLGERSPKDASTAQLRSYVAELQQRELAAETVRKHVSALKAFYAFLREEGCIEGDPSQRIPRPKVPKRLPEALTIPQVQALFRVMRGQSEAARRDQVFFHLMYACGLRIGEAIRLRVEDVNFSDGWLRVLGKGDKERRLYLKPYLVDRLRQYVDPRGLTGYLFPGNRDGHVDSGEMHRRLKRYAAEAGLPDTVRPHTLRHSIAVHYLLDGAPISAVQGLLGHASLATTGIYTRLADEMTREIALQTPTAVDGMEGKLLGERSFGYRAEFGGFLESLFG
jgi:site-specific recombinase XerD